MDKLAPTLAVLLVQLPVILIWLIGQILSLVFWRRHPKVSLLTFIAMIGFLIVSIIGTYLNIWLPLTLRERGLAISQIGIALTVSGLINSFVSAVFWVLLVIAIFGWRSRQEAS
jgi:hypothetical protein